MAEIVKFHEKNIALFGKIEASSGTYETGIVAADALAATTMTGSVTYETGNYTYTGDSLSRDEFNYQKDSYADVSVETPQQVLGVLNPSLTVANAPLSKYFRACGGAVTVNGSTGVVTISNDSVENSSISINYTKTSSADAVNGKLYKFFGCRGTVDVTANVGEIPILKFAFKGNANNPVQAAIMSPDFQSQTVSASSVVRQSSIVAAQLTPYGENFNSQSTISGTPSIARTGTTATVTLTSHGLTTGRLVNISGVTGADGSLYNGDFAIAVVDANTFTYTMVGTPTGAAAGTIVVKKDGYAKSFCFDKLSATNFFGFDYQRYLTGCEEGFAKGAVPTDVSVTMLESHAPRFDITSITHSTNTATVTVNTAHGLTTGNSVTISGATGVDASIYNITALVTVTSSTAFTYVMGSSPASNATGSLSFVNNSVTSFDPDSNVSNFFSAQVKFGTGAGKYVTYKWDKLQLSNVKEDKVATYFGRGVSFRNTGKSYIILE